MATDLDLGMIRRTLDALHSASDEGARNLLYMQLDSLRAGCEHTHTTMLRSHVPVRSPGYGEQLCDILECADCLVGLVRPVTPSAVSAGTRLVQVHSPAHCLVPSAAAYRGSPAARELADQVRGYLGQGPDPMPYPLAIGPGTAL